MALKITNMMKDMNTVLRIDVDIDDTSDVVDRTVKLFVPFSEGYKIIGFQPNEPLFNLSPKLKEMISEGEIKTIDLEFEEGYANFDSLNFDKKNITLNITFPKSTIELSDCFYKTQIKDIVFKGNSDISMSYAFWGCIFLEEFKLPKGVEFINVSCFENCEFKKGFSFNSTLKEIANFAFQNTIFPKDFCLSFPANLEHICFHAFQGSVISEIYLKGNNLCVEEYAFHESSVKKVKLEGDLICGNHVFDNCRNLKEVDLKNWNNDFIPVGFCCKCCSLNKVIFPANLKDIKPFAFCRTGFTSITFPKSLEALEDNCFRESTIESICFEDDICNIKNIGQGAFSGSSISKIPDYMFENCVSIGINVFSKAKFEKIEIYAPDPFVSVPSMFEDNLFLKSVVLKNGKNSWSSIYCSMFSGCKSLTEISYPDTVMVLRKKAFELSGLCSFVGGKSLNEIEDECFNRCKNLNDVDLSNSNIEFFGKGCFPFKEYNSFKLNTFCANFEYYTFSKGVFSKKDVEEMLKEHGNFFVSII